MADSSFLGGTHINDRFEGGAENNVFYGYGGNDTLIGGAGNDALDSKEYLDSNSVTGFREDFFGDWLDGGDGNDSLQGGSGADYLVGGSGTNLINGGGGLDTAIYAGQRASYSVQVSNSKPVGVTSVGVTDTVSMVERLQFADKSVAFDIAKGDNAGDMYRLYEAAFDRNPDAGGLGFWISASDRGYDNLYIAGQFMASQEFINKYGANTSNNDFLTSLYNNILDRPYDQGGFDFWMNALNSGASRAEVLNEFAQSPENIAGVIGEIQNGIEYTLYLG
ncbi:DUF4214 domain-containing protein [Massilia sp. METH4]|uniref:DUF4214 domain-containing protein n=1 Tax=Massilia sp. METH4 TaxID=3123041 RepID=UPI0030D4450D